MIATTERLGCLGAAAIMPELGVLTPTDLLSTNEPQELDVAARLGRKGLRYNTRATLLALCAAGDIFGAGKPELYCAPERLGLIAISRFGVADAVADAARTVAEHGANALSPMGLPNASSNVLASQLAIRYAIKGVCLTVEDGDESAAHALGWATVLIEGGRCDEVLVVAAEADGPAPRWLSGRPVVTGSLALLLTRADKAQFPLTNQSWHHAPTDKELGTLIGLVNYVVPRRQGAR